VSSVLTDNFKGMDIPDVDHSVQYMVPSSLSVWTQCAGCIGRSGQPALAILLVEPSVFQTKKKKGATGTKENAEDESSGDEDEDNEVNEDCTSPDKENSAASAAEHKKKVEEGMRDWIEAINTLQCRRAIANKHFHNPPRTTAPTIPCCNTCILRKKKDLTAVLTEAESAILALIERIQSRTKPVLEQETIADPDIEIPSRPK
jgi:superfamily II DNA helicase RecQ